MSWDKYNEARKKAKQAQSKLDKASDTVDKLTGKSSKKLTKSEINQVKTAAKNAKSNKWLFAIWAVITILALVSLLFSDFFEDKLNTTIERDGIITSSVEARENSKLNINYINVLQGDCILINLPDGKNMIIDAGSSFNYDNKYPESSSDNVLTSIKNYLVDSSNPKIDYMIMTHSDFDHNSFMPEILDEFEVTKMYRPNVFYAAPTGEKNQDKLDFTETERALAASVGSPYVTKDMYQADKDTYDGYNVKDEDNASYYTVLSKMYAEAETNGGDSEVLFTFQVDEITNANDPNVSADEIYTLTFYAPWDNQHLYTDWNNYSAFMILEYNDFYYCFTGDTEQELEEQILAEYGDSLPDVDIMDAGHHGSATSTSAELLDVLNPEVVICSCDDGSEYGHPAPDTINRIIASGVPQNNIFTTHLNGNICVALDYDMSALEDDTSTATGDTEGNSGETTASTTPTEGEITSDTGVADEGNAGDTALTDSETSGSTTTEGEAGDTSTLDPSADTSQLTPGAIEGTTYMVGISQDGTITVTEIKWWYIVVGIIVVSGVVLLVIAPSIVKSVKKKK